MTDPRASAPIQLALCLAAALLAAAALPASAAAVDFHVTTTNDVPGSTCAPGNCSLRQAVNNANADPANDNIILGAGTYRLTLADTGGDNGNLVAKTTMAITGAGARSTTID